MLETCLDNPPTTKQAQSIHKQIYSEVVQNAIRNTPPNSKPTAAMERNPAVEALLRAYRTILSQLSSGHCMALNTYRSIICFANSTNCLHCVKKIPKLHPICSPAFPYPLGSQRRTFGIHLSM